MHWPWYIGGKRKICAKYTVAYTRFFAQWCILFVNLEFLHAFHALEKNARRNHFGIITWLKCKNHTYLILMFNHTMIFTEDFKILNEIKTWFDPFFSLWILFHLIAVVQVCIYRRPLILFTELSALSGPWGTPLERTGPPHNGIQSTQQQQAAASVINSGANMQQPSASQQPIQFQNIGGPGQTFVNGNP